MAVNVYIWSHDRAAAWGHTSLSTSNPPCYVSWWPDADRSLRRYLADKQKRGFRHRVWASLVGGIYGTTNVYKTKHANSEELLEDIRKEGKPADVVATIADGLLNERQICSWWERYNYQGASYHVVKKNCSTTVLRALRAGGSDRHVSFLLRDNIGTAKYFGNEPTTVHGYLKDLARNRVGFVTFEESAAAIQIQAEQPTGGVEMCAAHGYPLLDCPNC